MGRRSPAAPKALRSLIGGAVLVGSVRIIDEAWRRFTGRPTPVDVSDGTDPDADNDAGAPAVVRDRLVYALLLGAAIGMARRVGLPVSDGSAGSDVGPGNGRSPA